MWNYVKGDLNLEELVKLEQSYTLVFFCTYYLVMNMIIINMFLAI